MILLPATVFGPVLEQDRSKTGYEFWGHGLWAGGGFWPLKQGPDLTPVLAKKWVQNRIFQKWGVFRSILGMVYYARVETLWQATTAEMGILLYDGEPVWHENPCFGIYTWGTP